MLEKMNKVDKTSPLPLYYQLKESIIKVIKEEGIPPGQKIPSERSMCDYHEVSRMTVHKAIEGLVQEGYLFREQGKGTYVAERKEINMISPLASFTEEIKSRGLKATTKIIDCRPVEGRPEIYSRLNLDKGNKLFRLQRLRSIEGVPFLWETVFLPFKYFSDLEKNKLAGKSLYRLMEDEYDLELDYAEATVEPILMKDEVAQRLKVSENELGLLFHQLTFLRNGDPIEWTEAYYRSENYKFKLKFGKEL